MESFIYLLITVVILVLSMKKKKQVELPEDEQEERPGDPFRDLFGSEEEAEEYNGYNEQEALLRRHEETEQEVNYRLDKPREQEEPNPWMTSEEANQMVMDSDAIMKEASENNPISELGVLKEDDAYEIGLSDDQQISFDLKKAVIYSEIIEKRTF